jgi:LemA protein
MKLSRTAIIWIIVAAIVLIGVLWFIGSYNSLVKADVTVDEKWANVQTAYERRADLIPNLVETVKQYASHEESVFLAVTEARAKVGSATTPAQLNAAGEEMNSAIARLLLVAENYPQLRASENFLSLQDELAGTENRIKTDRDIFNKAVKDYNIKTRKFPSNIIANMFGFEQREMFEAEAGAETAPVVGELF